MTLLDALALARGPAFLIVIGIAIAAIRSPLVRRIGLRNAVRRPREALLVMLGCVLGTALIVGSGSVQDSYAGSIRARAFERLGPIDAKVTYENAADWADANARLNAERVAGVRTTTAAAMLEVPMTADTSPEPAPKVRVIEADYRRAGNLSEGAGAGTGPTPGTAWVGRAMAQRLNLKVNAVLTIHTRVAGQQLRVTKIVDNALVNFVDGTVAAGDNLLVTPGTIETLRAQEPDVLVPQYFTLVEATTPHTNDEPARSDVQALRERISDRVAPFNGTVAMVRAESLAAANQLGNAAAQLLVTVGAYGIIAGLLLLVNVLLMLAEERLSELGTMRAVGMAREPLVAAFTLEGATYALVGSIAGGFAGWGLGRFMVMFASRTTTAAAGVNKGLQIRFFAEPSTLVSGVAAGFVLSALVVMATSFRVSRLEVIRSIRGLPAARRTPRSAWLPLLVAGVVIGPVVGVVGYTTKSAFPLLLGPLFAFACLGLLVRRTQGYEVGTLFATVPALVWCTVFLFVNTDLHAPQNAGTAAGVLQVTTGVLFVNAIQARLAGAVRRIGRGRGAISSRLGLANPLAHRIRTLLTVGPFALVVFTLTYAEGLSNLLVSEVTNLGPHIGGAYTVHASSSPAHPFAFTSLDSPDITSVAPIATLVGSFSGGAVDQRLWSVSGFDRRLLRVEPPTLLGRDKRYHSDREAYAAVAADPNLIIVPTTFLWGETQSLGRTRSDPANPPQPGAVFTMIDPVSGASRDVTVAATTYADVSGYGAFYGLPGLRAMFGDRAVETSALIATNGDKAQLVQQLMQAGVDNGVQASIMEEDATHYFDFVHQVVNLFRSDLGIGIVVGIAGIGVVLVRSVRDRRQQIGTLRAMGVESRQIGSSFMIEGGFTAVQGLAIGAGLGFVNVMTLTKSPLIVSVFGYEPSAPPPTLALGLIAVLLLVASLAASVGPAQSASRIPPAVALRVVD